MRKIYIRSDCIVMFHEKNLYYQIKGQHLPYDIYCNQPWVPNKRMHQ